MSVAGSSAAGGSSKLERTWLPALRRARAGAGTADVLWFGDSLSELDPNHYPMPWFVGRVLSDWIEEVQYRQAGGSRLTPSMTTTGTPAEPVDAGFGGRSVHLAEGGSATLRASGRAVTVIWTRQPSGGSLLVNWGPMREVIDTSGSFAHGQTTLFEQEMVKVSQPLVVTAERGGAHLEGVYVHRDNARVGVRVWPAVKTGSRTQDFVDHPGWGLDALSTIRPDLVLIATGTNIATDYEAELDALLSAVRERDQNVDIAVWVPFLNAEFTPSRAASGRAVATRRGCAIVDGAAVLGRPPTIEGVHPTSISTAMAAAHLLTSISEDPLATLSLMAGQAGGDSLLEQSWYLGSSSVSIDGDLGSPVLNGRDYRLDLGHAWAMLLPSFAAQLGHPGSTLSFGPGGDDPIDTHLSRAGRGRFTVNGGSGEVEVRRLLVTPSAPGDEALPPGSGAALFLPEDGDGYLSLQLSDGSVRAVAPALTLPLPCAFSAPAGPPVTVELTDQQVTWIPLPALAHAVEATDVWVEVVDPVAGAVATIALVDTEQGWPGSAVGSTSEGGVDLSTSGVVGGRLEPPVVLSAGRIWWLAVAVTTSDPVGARGGVRLEGRPALHAGTEPVVPSAGDTGGALITVGSSSIPDRPPRDGFTASGPVPAIHLSVRSPGPA